MEDGSTAAPPAGQRDPRPPHGRQVALGPGVLVAADDHRRLVPAQQQDAALLQVYVGVDPVLQRQVLVHVGGPGAEDQPGLAAGGCYQAADGGGASPNRTAANTPGDSEKRQRPPDVCHHGGLLTQSCHFFMSETSRIKNKAVNFN